jgi:hypothetical protein
VPLLSSPRQGETLCHTPEQGGDASPAGPSLSESFYYSVQTGRGRRSKSRTRTTTTRRIGPKQRAMLEVVGRGSVRTGRRASPARYG